MSAEYNSPAKAGSAWTWIKETAPAITKGKLGRKGWRGRGSDRAEGSTPVQRPRFCQFHLTETGRQVKLSLIPLCFLIAVFFSLGGAPNPATTLRYCNNNKVNTSLKSEQSSTEVLCCGACACGCHCCCCCFVCLFLMNLLIHKCSAGIPIAEIHEKEDEICELLLSLVPASLETLPIWSWGLAGIFSMFVLSSISEHMKEY